jgi:hypothetical protein
MIGGKTRDKESTGAAEDKEIRLPYQTPAIVYEGNIDIRAGSPFFTDEDLTGTKQ